MQIYNFGPSANVLRTAITVMNSGAQPMLCPFFGKCDGLLIVTGANGSKEFHANEERTPEKLCDLILSVKPDQLVCGYVGKTEKHRLQAAGIDVRMGSCSCPVDELLTCICDLPEA